MEAIELLVSESAVDAIIALHDAGILTDVETFNCIASERGRR
jgi:hypothetical protein